MDYTPKWTVPQLVCYNLKSVRKKLPAGFFACRKGYEGQTMTKKKSKTSHISASSKPAAEPAPSGLKILFASPEAVPFAGTGGLGDVAGSLPAAVRRKSPETDIRLIMPLYKKVGKEYREKMRFLGSREIPVAWRMKYMGVFALEHDGITCYFIDNEEYFGRDGLYGYFDDCERFTFFARACFESMELTGFEPDLIHANDWQTAMVPVFQNGIYKMPDLRTILTIHNIEYQGRYGMEVFRDILGLPDESRSLVEYEGGVNLLKGGIEAANVVSTVSPTYAEELRSPEFACGLDPMIQKNAGKLTGILNGIDTALYDPEKDKILHARYSAEQPAGKSACKADLQGLLMLPMRNVPIIAMISRLVPHKGVDLITAVIDEFLSGTDAQFVLLGTGDSYYENFFRKLEQRFPDKVRALIMFDRDLSRRIYAGADLLLMPSKSEPCGLSQMIAMRYGTVPIVRETGGLKDSVKDCSLGSGNGFTFSSFAPESLLDTLRNAVRHFRKKEDWKALVRYDLGLDYSWDSSAARYLDLYHNTAR